MATLDFGIWDRHINKDQDRPSARGIASKGKENLISYTSAGISRLKTAMDRMLQGEGNNGGMDGSEETTRLLIAALITAR